LAGRGGTGAATGVAEEEIRKLREAALRNDPAVAMKKIPGRATADFLANSCGQIATSRKIH
jgi:hypothetical protein